MTESGSEPTSPATSSGRLLRTNSTYVHVHNYPKWHDSLAAEVDRAVEQLLGDRGLVDLTITPVNKGAISGGGSSTVVLLITVVTTDPS